MGNKLRHPKKAFSQIQFVGQFTGQKNLVFLTYKIHRGKKEGKMILQVLQDQGDIIGECNMQTLNLQQNC